MYQHGFKTYIAKVVDKTRRVVDKISYNILTISLVNLWQILE